MELLLLTAAAPFLTNYERGCSLELKLGIGSPLPYVPTINTERARAGLNRPSWSCAVARRPVPVCASLAVPTTFEIGPTDPRCKEA